MANKIKMIGLSCILQVDDYLVRENCSLFDLFYANYRIESLISFCNYGKFLDEKAS